MQRDKAKESVAGYELRIKKYIEELKVATGKVSDGEAAMGKLRIEMTESRKTVNEVRSDALPGAARLTRDSPSGSCSYCIHKWLTFAPGGAQTYEVRIKELREQLAAEQRELAERTRKFELEVRCTTQAALYMYEYKTGVRICFLGA